MKRILLIAAPLIVLLGAILFVAPRIRSQGEVSGMALHLLSPDAMMLVRINAWAGVDEAFRDGDGLLASLVATGRDTWIRLLVHRLDSLAESGSGRMDAWRRGEGFLGVYAEGRGDEASLLSLQLTESGLSTSRMVGALFADAQQVRQIDYEGTTIAECVLGDRATPVRCYAAVRGKVALWSSSNIQLQRALRRGPHDASLLGETSFRSLYESADGRRPVNLFVRAKDVGFRLGPYFVGSWRKMMERSGGWTSWIAFDVDDTSASLGLLGESRFSDSLKCAGDAMRQLRPVEMVVASVLPSTSAFFVRWAAGSGEELVQFLRSGNSPAASEPSSTSNKGVEEAWQLLQSVCSGELTLALIRGDASAPTFWAVVLSSESPSEAVSALGQYSAAHGGEGASAGDIHRFAQRDMFRKLLGDCFPGDVAARCVALDRCVAFCASVEGARYLLSTAHRKQTLARSEGWESMLPRLQSKCNYMLYADLASAPQWAKGLMEGALFGGKTLVSRLATGSTRIAFQVSGASHNQFYNLTCDRSTVADVGHSTVWEAGLKAPLTGRPMLVKSHRASDNLILVQDRDGGLYLIGGDGATLWYRMLGEPILGDAVPVDCYRNGKWQYAFATRSKVWVIDYDGNTVEGFPYALPAPAAGPLAVFDYAGNGDYRFVVPCTDRQIALVDARGRRKGDFHPKPMESAPTGPALHVQFQGMDFIVLSDANRLYLLNRKGEERLRTSEPVRKHACSPIVPHGGGAGTLMLLDAEGRICSVSLHDGKVVRSAQLEGWGGCEAIHFESATGTGQARCHVVMGSRVRGYTQAGKRIYEVRMEGALAPWIKGFDFGSRGMLMGVCAAESGREMLLDGNGKVRAEFRGDTPFSIGRIDKSGRQLRLVAGDRSSILVYGVNIP